MKKIIILLVFASVFNSTLSVKTNEKEDLQIETKVKDGALDASLFESKNKEEEQKGFEENKMDLSLEYVKQMKVKIEKEKFLVDNQVVSGKAWQQLEVCKDEDGGHDYICNGAGPGYSQEEYEQLKQEGKGGEMDQMPQMPKKQPEVLLQMQEYLVRLKGIPVAQSPALDKDLKWNATTIAMARQLEQDNRGQDNLISQNMARFIEDKESVQSSSKEKEKQKGKFSLQLEWQAANFKRAWASSVWSFRFLWWSVSYRASYATQFLWYWCSAGWHGKDDVVTWQGDMTDMQRVHHVWIFWAYAPGKYKMQVTQDNKSWSDKMDWTGHKLFTSFFSFFKFRWRWWYSSYAENINFDDPQLFQGVRLLMKDPVNYFYGIYRVFVWVKQWTVMLISGSDADGDLCLVTKNGKYENNQDIMAQPCVDAIAASDYREIFQMQVNGQLTSFEGGKCVENRSGDSSDQGTFQLMTCIWSMLMFDQRDKFDLDKDNMLRLRKNTKKCMFLIDKEYQAQEQQGTQVWASSETADCQHSPKLMIDGDDQSYWSTQPGVDHAIIKMSFPEETVKEIVINWQNKPKKFELLIFFQGYWKSLGVKPADQSQYSTSIGIKGISGIKLILQGAQSEISTANGQFKTIGIHKVQLKTGYRKIGVRECDKQDNSKWTFSDVYFANKDGKLLFYSNLMRLYGTINNLLFVIRITIRLPYYIAYLIHIGAGYAERMTAIQTSLETIGVNLAKLQNTRQYDIDDKLSFSKFIPPPLMVKLGGQCGISMQPVSDKPVKHKKPMLGTVSKHPSNSCFTIKKLAPFKKSGYYWIKPDCVPNPLRVFCDFDNFKFGKDLAYYGRTTSAGSTAVDVKSRKDALKQCAQLGLEYYEFESEKELEMVKNYLIDIGVDFGQDFMVPIFYDYQCGWECSGKWRSLKSEKSPEQTYAGEAIDSQNIFNQVWNFIFGAKPKDTLGLGNSKKGKLVKFELGGKRKVGGVICSTNPPKEGPSEPMAELKCDDILKGNPDISMAVLAQSVAVCPAGCVGNKAPVIGKDGKYSEESSICRAAIHSGVIDPNGGIFNVQVEQGLQKGDTYESSEANDIKTEAKDGPSFRSFSIVKLKKKDCPNDVHEKEQKTKEKAMNAFLQIDQRMTFKKRSKGKVVDKTVIQGGHQLLEEEPLEHLTFTQLQDYSRDRLRRITNNNNTHTKIINNNNTHTKIINNNNTHTKIINNDNTHTKIINNDNTFTGQEEPINFLQMDTRVAGAIEYSPDDIKGNKAIKEVEQYLKGHKQSKDIDKPQFLQLDQQSREDREKSETEKMGEQQKEEAEKKEKEGKKEDEEDEEEDATTESTYKKVAAFLAFDEAEMSKDVHLADDALNLRKDVQGQLSPLLYAELSPIKQLARLVGLVQHMWGIYWEQFKVMSIGKMRIKMLFSIKMQFLCFQAFGGKYTTYYQNYHARIDSNWRQFDLKTASDGPAKWQMAREDLNGHKTSITDLSKATTGDASESVKVGSPPEFGINFASHLILNGKAYYDVNLFMSFQAVDNNNFGIAFRYIDAFNYYAVEFRRGGWLFFQAKGYKRIVKVSNGEYTVLAEIEDGGYSTGIWYNMVVEAVGSKFSLKLKEEVKGQVFDYNPNGLETVLEAMDNRFSMGTVALLNNGNQGVMYDRIYFVTLECQSKSIGNQPIVYEGPTSFRYREKCLGEFSYNVYNVDDAEVDGEWKCKKNFDGTYGAVIQSQQPKSKHESQIPSICYFKTQTKWMQHFTMEVNFKVKKGDGYVGLAFHYHGKDNHYTFEIFGEKMKKCRLREAGPNGNYKIIQEVQDGCSYKNNKVHRLILRRIGNALVVYLSKDTPDQLFIALQKDIQWSLQKGVFAFISFQNEVEFSKIVVMPNDDFDESALGDLKGAGEDKVTAEALADDKQNNKKDPKKSKGKKKKKKKEKKGKEGEEQEDEESDSVGKLIEMKQPTEVQEQTCEDYHDKKRKLGFCKNRFVGQAKPIAYCMQNYCQSCCQSLSDEQLQIKQCMGKCNSKTKPQVSDVWHYCIDSPNLQQSIYPFCDTVNSDSSLILKYKCQARMCQTCCSMANSIFDIDIKNDDIFECITECEDRYLMTPLANSSNKKEEK